MKYILSLLLALVSLPAFSLSTASNWGQGSAQSACVTPTAGKHVYVYGYSADTADSVESTLTEVQITDAGVNFQLRFAATSLSSPADHINQLAPLNLDSGNDSESWTTANTITTPNLTGNISLSVPATNGTETDPDSQSGAANIAMGSYTITGTDTVSSHNQTGTGTVTVPGTVGYWKFAAGDKVCVQFNAAATNQYEFVSLYYTIQ